MKLLLSLIATLAVLFSQSEVRILLKQYIRAILGGRCTNVLTFASNNFFIFYKKAASSPKKKLAACISSYPGTSYPVTGRVVVKFDDTTTTDLKYSFRLQGLESSIEGAGTHIHSGTTCYNASKVGGHYWDKGTDGTNPDPWTAAYGAVYSTKRDGSASGAFDLNSGYNFLENKGHAVVVHAADGTRVGCGVLGSMKTNGRCRAKKEIKKLQACISAYPGTEYAASGKIVVSFNTTTADLNFKYRLRNLEASIEGAGVHIHSGTTCSDASKVGGHYWNKGANGTNPDPWTAEYGAVYSTNANGKGSGDFDLNSGYTFKENVGHAVVVHAANGTRVGCGVLGKLKAKCGN